MKTIPPRIAVFDYKITSTTPIGSCHRVLLDELCEEFDFTVFAAEFENPRPDRIKYVRIPVPTKPLALLFISFQILAPLIYLWHRITTGARFAMVQSVETYTLLGSVIYAQFCHKAYLEEHWSDSRPPGLRGIVRWLDHALRASLERSVFSRASAIVVPSHGLADELTRTYPGSKGRISVISNPVDTQHYGRPKGFDPSKKRLQMGFAEDDLVMSFVALGHFERKGLPFVLSAMSEINNPNLKLVVVGGATDLIAKYERYVEEAGLAGRVAFTGLQEDIRPWLWSSDAFIFPSNYETFSLATFQAAAAGLTILVPQLYGVREFLIDGQTGIEIHPNVQGVLEGIKRLMLITPSDRACLGLAARQSILAYNVTAFAMRWRSLYASLLVQWSSQTQADECED